MGEISLPPWLQFKPGSEAMTEQARSGTSNFTELGRLNNQNQEQSNRNAEESRAKALFPLVQQENDFKVKTMAAQYAILQQQMQGQLNSTLASHAVLEKANEFVKNKTFGTDEAGVAITQMGADNPALFKNPAYINLMDQQKDAAKARNELEKYKAQLEPPAFRAIDTYRQRDSVAKSLRDRSALEPDPLKQQALTDQATQIEIDNKMAGVAAGIIPGKTTQEMLNTQYLTSLKTSVDTTEGAVAQLNKDGAPADKIQGAQALADAAKNTYDSYLKVTGRDKEPTTIEVAKEASLLQARIRTEQDPVKKQTYQDELSYLTAKLPQPAHTVTTYNAVTGLPETTTVKGGVATPSAPATPVASTMNGPLGAVTEGNAGNIDETKANITRTQQQLKTAQTAESLLNKIQGEGMGVMNFGPFGVIKGIGNTVLGATPLLSGIPFSNKGDALAVNLPALRQTVAELLATQGRTQSDANKTAAQMVPPIGSLTHGDFTITQQEAARRLATTMDFVRDMKVKAYRELGVLPPVKDLSLDDLASIEKAGITAKSNGLSPESREFQQKFLTSAQVDAIIRTRFTDKQVEAWNKQHGAALVTPIIPQPTTPPRMTQ